MQDLTCNQVKVQCLYLLILVFVRHLVPNLIEMIIHNLHFLTDTGGTIMLFIGLAIAFFCMFQNSESNYIDMNTLRSSIINKNTKNPYLNLQL